MLLEVSKRGNHCGPLTHLGVAFVQEKGEIQRGNSNGQVWPSEGQEEECGKECSRILCSRWSFGAKHLTGVVKEAFNAGQLV